jgi:putative phage-type endonuclease
MDRTKSIGGSDSAAVLNISPYKSKIELYLEKTNQLLQNDKEKEKIFERGKIIEPFLCLYFEKILKSKIESSILLTSDKEYITGNIDGYCAAEEAIIEFKTSAITDGWGEQYTDQIPKHYLLQCHHYLMLHPTAKKVYVYVLQMHFDALELLMIAFKKYGASVEIFDEMSRIKTQMYIIHKDEEHQRLAEILRQEYDIFWNQHVLKNIPPAISSIDDLKLLFPESQDTKIIATEEELNLIEAFKNKQIDITTAKQELEDLKFKICARLENANMIVDSCNKKLVTFKTQTTNRLNLDQLKLKYPEATQDCFVATKTRVFRLS